MGVILGILVELLYSGNVIHVCMYVFSHIHTFHVGWGGNYSNGSYGPPLEGDDVIILPGMWVIIDSASLPLPKFGNITIYGTLEVDKDEELDVELNTEIIWIAGDEGRLVAGFDEPGDHYPGNLTLLLRGNFTYPEREFVIPGGPAIGRKAIGMFKVWQM